MDHTSDLWRDALWLCPRYNHHHLKKNLMQSKLWDKHFVAMQARALIGSGLSLFSFRWPEMMILAQTEQSSKWIMQQTADSSLVNFLLLGVLGNNVGLIVMFHKVHKGVTISLFTRMCIIIIIANLPAASFPSTFHPTWSVFTHALSPEPLRWSF